MRILTAAIVTLMVSAYSTSDMMPNFVSAAFAEIDESTEKVMEIQRALKEFGFYKGKVDGKTRRSLYDAMSKYTAYVRSKGWSNATGELTEEEIAFLLKQYDKRFAASSTENSYSGTEASSDQTSAPSSSSGSVAAEGGGSIATASPGIGASAGSTGSATGGGASATGGGSVIDPDMNATDALK